MQKKLREFVLASASPRRRELLRLICPEFMAISVDAEETTEEKEPGRMVRALAEKKAQAALLLPEMGKKTVIAADTLVFLEGKPLGKPRDAADAHRMLRALAGRTHSVLTGVAVAEQGRMLLESECTEVSFAPMSEEEIADYVATGDPLDKAGAYGIQGYAARFIRGINGCYFNVVGLPVHRLYTMLFPQGV